VTQKKTYFNVKAPNEIIQYQPLWRRLKATEKPHIAIMLDLSLKVPKIRQTKAMKVSIFDQSAVSQNSSNTQSACMIGRQNPIDIS